MRTKKQKFQSLAELITDYVELQHPDDEILFSMSEDEARRRSEQARGKAEQVVSLLFDTGMWDVIRKHAGIPD